MSNNHFDVIAIGVGMAGLSVARKTAAAGKKVAVIDSRPYGGTCALRGCDPKKVLVGAAEVVDWQRRMTGHGVTGDVRIDWSELMAFKRTFTEPVPQNLEKSLGEQGIATYYGETRFINPNCLQVGEDTLTGEHIVVAVGARPVDLGIPGAEHVITSTDFLELESLPKRVVFIGGGYISFEFAHIAARAGARATILHRGERPLQGFDADMVAGLVDASREVGIDVRVNTAVTAVEKQGDALAVHTDGQTVTADLVVHGAGRVPEIDALDLEAGNVEYSPKKGVAVNEYLQSVSNPAVYAAGDAAATEGWPLTPVAVHEGLTVASNILKGNRKTPNYLGTPAVAFTIPSLSRAGMTEDEAAARGFEFRVNHNDTSGWYSSRRTNEKHSAYKVLIEEGTSKILGAHLLGGHAGEVINMFALAIRHGLTASEVKTSVLVHPAASSDISYML
jgi:glutathione reductase (NADPH)